MHIISRRHNKHTHTDMYIYIYIVCRSLCVFGCIHDAVRVSKWCFRHTGKHHPFWQEKGETRFQIRAFCTSFRYWIILASLLFQFDHVWSRWMASYWSPNWSCHIDQCRVNAPKGSSFYLLFLAHKASWAAAAAKTWRWGGAGMLSGASLNGILQLPVACSIPPLCNRATGVHTCVVLVHMHFLRRGASRQFTMFVPCMIHKDSKVDSRKSMWHLPPPSSNMVHHTRRLQPDSFAQELRKAQAETWPRQHSAALCGVGQCWQT